MTTSIAPVKPSVTKEKISVDDEKIPRYILCEKRYV